MADKKLDYSGKPKDLSRKIGMNPGGPEKVATIKTRGDQRALLVDTLDAIINISEVLIKEAEADLVKIAVLVPEASSTKRAFSKEWPAELGDITDKMSFAQYKILQKKNSAAAVMLRTYFLKHLRMSDNGSLLDIYNIILIINQEAKRMKAFDVEYIKERNGQEKGPAYNLFQNWASQALVDLNNLWNYAVRRPIKNPEFIQGKNVKNITEKDAKAFQATIQGRVNAVNSSISMNLAAIEKSHGPLADKFYKEFLGPAMNFRESISEPYERTRSHTNTSFSTEIQNDTQVYSNNLKGVLADQMTRNNTYSEKIVLLTKLIESRDQYLAQIILLSSIGSAVVPQVVEHEPTDEEIKLYQSYTGTQEDIFKASHDFLDDLENPDAHPQYLLKDGGTVIGDIVVEDGVKVDGVDLSEHVHNGTDGSPKIDARDLVEGSLGIASIDKNEEVFTPIDLQFVSSSTRLNAATTLIDVTLKWKGDTANKFELQVAPVRTHTNTEVDNVFNIIKEAPGADMPESGYETFWSNFANSGVGPHSWSYILSEDVDLDGEGDFNSRGIGDGALGNKLILNGATNNTASQVQHLSFADNDFYTDVNMPHPRNVSNSWVTRSDGRALLAAGNKLYYIGPPGPTTTTLKTFSDSSTIYSISTDRSNGNSYIFVKNSDFSDDPLKSKYTTIELWKITQANVLSKLYTWDNEESIDKALDDEDTPHGWFTDAINEKDYSLINIGFVDGDYIYSFCLYNLSDTDFYSNPDLKNNTLPVLCRFSLTTKTKEIVKAHDGSYILCFGDGQYMSPHPIIKDDVMYLPGNVVLSKETINNTAITNSIVKIQDTVFSRQYIATSDAEKVQYRNCMLDADNNVYALGIYEDSYISVGEPLGAIYAIGDL